MQLPGVDPQAVTIHSDRSALSYEAVATSEGEYGFTASMSRKGRAVIMRDVRIFGRMKMEMFYGRTWNDLMS